MVLRSSRHKIWNDLFLASTTAHLTPIWNIFFGARPRHTRTHTHTHRHTERQTRDAHTEQSQATLAFLSLSLSCAATVNTLVRQQRALCALTLATIETCAPTTGTFVRRQWTRFCANKEHLCAPTVRNTLARRRWARLCANNEHFFPQQLKALGSQPPGWSGATLR